MAAAFANGKTTALVADALRIARDYPGAVMLLARSTYPKLNSTLRREFFKWCPPAWIKSSNKNENTCVLVNGTVIDFRYIDMRNDGEGEGTSNLLSANYDYIAVDQIDDPEITERDFEHLLGRLRGATPRQSDDDTMPRSGPRMIALSCNPTLGWPYKRLVKPLHDFRMGLHNPNLICEVDRDGKPVLRDGRPVPLVDVFEASTYENAQNLEADYIKLLEATYRGKMRDRYLLGKWVAFEGAVYDEFDETMHVVHDDHMRQFISSQRLMGIQFGVLEGYDAGVTEPSCYLLGLVDDQGAVYICDGFYEGGIGIDTQAQYMHDARERWTVNGEHVWADPYCFRRHGLTQATVGPTIAEMFRNDGIIMRRGNNNIINGIIKVKATLRPRDTVINPFTHSFGAPGLYISHKLTFLRDEFATYRWRQQDGDTSVDVPVDKNNHAMDVLRYMLSERPSPGRMLHKPRLALHPQLRRWHEFDTPSSDQRSHRYMM